MLRTDGTVLREMNKTNVNQFGLVRFFLESLFRLKNDVYVMAKAGNQLVLELITS